VVETALPAEGTRPVVLDEATGLLLLRGVEACGARAWCVAPRTFFSTKDKSSGLAMIKKIIEDIENIEDMSGGMTLKSRVAKSTTVTLSLPPVLAVAEPTDASASQ